MRSMYRLCYVCDNIMYFTDNFSNQWGDDFNDAPYEHNAGTPYEWENSWSKEDNVKYGYGHIRLFAFEKDFSIKRPCDGYVNSPYSVEDINKGKVAWLISEEAGNLMAGATIKETKEWMKKANLRFGELKCL